MTERCTGRVRDATDHPFRELSTAAGSTAPHGGGTRRVQARPGGMDRVAHSAAIENLPCPAEDVIQHRGRQSPGLCVLPARVIRPDKQGAACQSVHDAVREPWTRPRDEAVACQQLQACVESDPAERHEDPDLGKGRELRVEVRQAIGHLTRRRSVIGRCTTHGRRDEGAGQREAVIGPARDWQVREPGPMQRRHEKVTGRAGPVTGEQPTCAVGAMGGWCETDDHEARTGVAKPGTGRPQ